VSRPANRAGPDSSGHEREMTERWVVTIPLDLLATVRAGAYRDLDCVLEEARDRVGGLDRDSHDAREQFVGLMGGVDDARALLDRIGWTGGRDDGPVEIDLHQYHPALQAALLDRLACEEKRLNTTAADEPAHAKAAGRIEAVRRLLDEIGDVAPGETGGRPQEGRVLLLLLADMDEVCDHEQARWWTVAEVEAALDDLDPGAVRYALDGLVAQEAAVRNGELVQASGCALHIDALGMITV
jgi:hypothetical protein